MIPTTQPVTFAATFPVTDQSGIVAETFYLLLEDSGITLTEDGFALLTEQANG